MEKDSHQTNIWIHFLGLGRRTFDTGCLHSRTTHRSFLSLEPSSTYLMALSNSDYVDQTLLRSVYFVVATRNRRQDLFQH